jgi:hypothetical protein
LNDVGEKLFLVSRADILLLYKNARPLPILARLVPAVVVDEHGGWRNLMAQCHPVHRLESMTHTLVGLLIVSIGAMAAVLCLDEGIVNDDSFGIFVVSTFCPATTFGQS